MGEWTVQWGRGRSAIHDAQGITTWTVIWPRCAGRLTSRNLWHSCGHFTLDALFASAPPATVDRARKYVAMLHSLGDVQVIPQKTRLVCVARVRFAGLYPRKDGFLVSLRCIAGLAARGSSGPLTMGLGGGGLCAHSIRAHLDPEFSSWLQEAHDVVGLQADLLPTTRDVL